MSDTENGAAQAAPDYDAWMEAFNGGFFGNTGNALVITKEANEHGTVYQCQARGALSGDPSGLALAPETAYRDYLGEKFRATENPPAPAESVTGGNFSPPAAPEAPAAGFVQPGVLTTVEQIADGISKVADNLAAEAELVPPIAGAAAAVDGAIDTADELLHEGVTLADTVWKSADGLIKDVRDKAVVGGLVNVVSIDAGGYHGSALHKAEDVLHAIVSGFWERLVHDPAPQP